MKCEIIVIGAGHAGCEAALASSRMGAKTLMVTLRADTIAQMSCNPSIGGVGKGQLVKEIDALGGEMAKATDASGIYFRVLNKSRGPAVWSSRAQVDRHRYAAYMREKILSQENLEVLEDEIEEIVTAKKKIVSVRTEKGDIIEAKAVIVATGTFLNGLIHIGLESTPGGRYGEKASIKLVSSLRGLGFEMARLKTGTTARIKRESIDFAKLKPQPGDEEPSAFSFSTMSKLQNRVICHIAHTNPKTHSIINSNLDRSPLYSGIITSTGVRYCPSIEDKVVKFSDKESHQIFMEPEGLNTDWYYPNGLSTSLPVDVQEEMIHSLEGLENAEIIRPGYGIEYEFIQPTQLLPTLEARRVEGLYFAGQINGTTGYEEAACQGLIAGVNAVLKSKNKTSLILERSSSYMGVLIDDLITKGTNEPYRMFTSRVEYRLMIREDNADLRLRRFGYDIGLVSENEFHATEKKRADIDKAVERLNAIRVKPTPEINRALEDLGTSALDKVVTAAGLLRRPQIDYKDLGDIGVVSDGLTEESCRMVEVLIKYEGFIKRQSADIEKMKDAEKIKIPESIDFSSISGLSREIVEKLDKINPLTLGQASRISGITPAAIMLLMVYLRKYSLGHARSTK